MFVLKLFPTTCIREHIFKIFWQGGRVQASIFSNDIELYEKTLSLLSSYYVSNAIVRPIAVTHQVVPHQFQWIISSHTLVEKVNDDEVNNVVPNYNFCLFSELKEYLNVASQVGKLIASSLFLKKIITSVQT